MPNYRRANLTGGTYFITQVTYHREPWLCREVGRKALREAIQKIREKYGSSGITVVATRYSFLILLKRSLLAPASQTALAPAFAVGRILLLV